MRPSLPIINLWIGLLVFLALASDAQARLVRLAVERREVVLDGRAFGLAGPYEKLVGTAHFAVDPDLPQNQIIVDLKLDIFERHPT